MLSTFNCCKASDVSDSQEEYGDRETEAIYSAIIEGNTEIKEAGELLDGEEQDADDDKDVPKESYIDAFKSLRTFTKKFGTNAAKSVEISDRLRKFRRKNDDSLDTLLHTAALFNKDPRIIALLMTCCPDLINIPRSGSYKGQTALHITIAKEKMEATEAILMNLRDKQILEVKATGPKFKNNIMMGETVLSVAVLTLNTNMVDLLLKYGAPIDQVNTKGDTVIHTLIKYAKIRPDKTVEVIKMLKFLKQKIMNLDRIRKSEPKRQETLHEKKDKREDGKRYQDQSKNKITTDLIEHMWFKENNDFMTPLKLVVSAGLIDVFQAMMKLKDVFYFPSNYDGFYDKRYYDITEIDHVAQYHYTTFKEQETLPKRKFRQTCNRLYQTCNRLCQLWDRLFIYHRPLSVIENLSTIDWKKAQPFVDTSQIKMVISRRWQTHKIPFYIFGVIHLMIMILFTTSVYYRKYVITECDSYKNDCQTAEMYAKVTPWVLVGYSAIIIASEVRRLLVLRQIWRPLKHHNNSWYRASLILFASGLFVDAYLYQWYQDSNDIIFIVLILGCWFLFFFLKGLEKFSVYTVLFQKVIMGDLLRFGLIIGIEFAAYSYAMYIVLRGNGDVEEFSNFENTTLTMFSYMLGLKDLSILDNVESQTQRLVAIIYIVFIISTYILLLNSLIAMMNGTSVNVFDDRKALNVLQRASVILFLDGFLFIPMLQRTVINDQLSSGPYRKHRFYLAIKTDQMGKFIREKQERKSFTLRDLLLKHKDTPKAKPDVVNSVRQLENSFLPTETFTETIIGEKERPTLDFSWNEKYTPGKHIDIYEFEDV